MTTSFSCGGGGNLPEGQAPDAPLHAHALAHAQGDAPTFVNAAAFAVTPFAGSLCVPGGQFSVRQPEPTSRLTSTAMWLQQLPSAGSIAAVGSAMGLHAMHHLTAPSTTPARLMPILAEGSISEPVSSSASFTERGVPLPQMILSQAPLSSASALAAQAGVSSTPTMCPSSILSAAKE